MNLAKHIISLHYTYSETALDWIVNLWYNSHIQRNLQGRNCCEKKKDCIYAISHTYVCRLIKGRLDGLPGIRHTGWR